MENQDLTINFGPITLFGSGETLPTSGKTYEYINSLVNKKPIISIIETPAGFQPNSEIVAGKVATFLQNRLQNYHPSTYLIPARKNNGIYSTNNEALLSPMLSSNWVFIGPGSPTYAVKHLSESLLLQYLYALHTTGCALVFSSAVVLAISTFTLPVYEIYKVGDELHWIKGLNFFNRFGKDLVFIPHWNNTSGGSDLDTNRCFMGVDRFTSLKKLIPENIPIIGIDEQTSLTITFQNQPKWRVEGIGKLTIILNKKETILPAGEYDPRNFGFAFQFSKIKLNQLSKTIKTIQQIKNNKINKTPPDEVFQLAEKRLSARHSDDWKTADKIREQILKLGWIVNDTAEGYDLKENKL